MSPAFYLLVFSDFHLLRAELARECCAIAAQTRGAFARAAIALLRFDDQSLTRHFLSGPEPLRHALDEYARLQQEIAYLKTHIEALETAATCVLCAASRCVEQRG